MTNAPLVSSGAGNWLADPPSRGQNEVHAWFGAPSVLSTMLALCEPPGWDLTPLQRRGRRNAATNAMRLWSVVAAVGNHHRGHQRTVTGTSARCMWEWALWRYPSAPVAHPIFGLSLVFDSGPLDFSIEVADSPQLHRNIEVRWVPLTDAEGGNSMLWRLLPGNVLLAYPQARAFIAALAFSLSPDVFEVRTLQADAGGVRSGPGRP
jgi:hypothetical protein